MPGFFGGGFGSLWLLLRRRSSEGYRPQLPGNCRHAWIDSKTYGRRGFAGFVHKEIHRDGRAMGPPHPSLVDRPWSDPDAIELTGPATLRGLGFPSRDRFAQD